MCGIFGFTHWDAQTDRLFPILADEMESRGGSSWGASDGMNFIKKLGAITKTIEPTFRKWDNKYGLIFHTRAPSAGTGRTVDDAHPFIFSKELTTINNTVPDSILTLRVTGIHNGYVASHTTLKTKYPERKDFSVDSMQLFKHICDDAPIEEITGSGAIAWFETIGREYLDGNTPPDYLGARLFLARFDTDNLHLGRLDTGEVVFASTKDAIEKAARLADVNIKEYLTIKARTKYELVKAENNQVNLVELEAMKFGSSTTSYSGGVIDGRYHAPGAHSPNFPQGPSGSHVSWPGNSGSSIVLAENADFNKCPSCSTTINPVEEAICDDCFAMYISLQSYVN